ncbi:MAG: DUF4236 domain-containing protein [Candidatus Acidiferrales bacterium]|jgi:hypothetical protein
MGWRFRKSFRVLPGVRLNLSKSGLSATVGVAPFHVNVGPRGVYGDVSIPGTGIYNRQRLDTPAVHHDPAKPPATPHSIPPKGFEPSTLPPTVPPETEIRSASTELLNSESMNQFRDLLRHASEERMSLENELSAANTELYTAKKRYQSWENGFLLRRIFKKSFAARKETFETAQAKATELSEQLRLTTLAAHFDMEREQAEPYYKMRDEFAVLCDCQRTWDTLSRQVVNRFVTRSAADEAVTRGSVRFSLSECDVLQWEQNVPHLPNRVGGDLYVYPGFVLYRASRQAFALIDFHDIKLEFRMRRFIEADPIPSDSQVVGQAWAKSNKDGSPDRRFKSNYQIPVVLYGELSFTSSSGLNEEFQFSNPALAQRFATAWDNFQKSFASAPFK